MRQVLKISTINKYTKKQNILYKQPKNHIQTYVRIIFNLDALIKTELSDFEARFMNVRQRLQKSNITKILK